MCDETTILFALYLLLPHLSLHELGQGDDGLEVGGRGRRPFRPRPHPPRRPRSSRGRSSRHGVHYMITILFLSFKKMGGLCIHVPSLFHQLFRIMLLKSSNLPHIPCEAHPRLVIVWVW